MEILEPVPRGFGHTGHVTEISREDQAERKRGKINFEAFIDRIELSRLAPHEAAESELKWSMSAFPMDTSSANVIILGHLFRVLDGALGQVRAVGSILAEDLDSSDLPAFEAFMEDYGHGFVESIYDMCRRALLANAVFMEIHLELPVRSPAAEIEIVLDEGKLSAEADDIEVLP